MLKCREVVDRADRLLDGDLNLRQRVAIKFHLLICHHCRRYISQLRDLVRAIPFMHRQASEAEVADVMAHIHQSTRP